MYKIKKPIRLIELFAGIGSQAKALKKLKIIFEHYKICEFDDNAVKAYNAIHNTDFKTSDITKIHANDLEIVDTDKYEYIMTYSFPCFTSDSLVLTSKGYKQISNIAKGDLVLSHDNKYHKVINVFNNGVHDVFSLKGMGVDEIKTTSNHKFYIREMYREGHKSVRKFLPPKWKKLKDISKKDYLGIAINQNEIPLLDSYLPTENNEFWWMIGRYLGDGWLRTQGGIIICCAKNELKELTLYLNKLPFKYNVVEDRTVYKVHIPNKKLGEFIKQFGKGALNKHLTGEIFDLPKENLDFLIKGYISADGCEIGKLQKATSISRELLYGIAQCVAKVYNTPYRIYRVKTNKTKFIEGRKVNQHDWYQLVFKKEKCKQDKAFYENGYIWYPIKEISKLEQENVYDIEVENSHSFTVQNTIVHNCQDLSVSGKQAGMKKGSGTRSGLLWEVERILSECTELPQILLMENVIQVHSEKNIEDFKKWQEFLEILGYKNFTKDLNSKDYGVPQNRKRCFMISILNGKDDDYEFPKPFELPYTFTHLLEDEVEEKYYIRTEKAKELIQNLIDKNKIPSPIIVDDTMGFDKEPRIYDKYSPTIRSNRSGLKILAEKPYNVAQRGRYLPDKTTKQQLEINNNKAVNCITTVAKDSMLLNQKAIIYDDYNSNVKKDQSCVGTITTTIGNTALRNGQKLIVNYELRNLTIKECFRLFSFDDEDYEAVKDILCKTQLYKKIGNSIVVDVLVNIFKQFIA